jgi:hypothetical protein
MTPATLLHDLALAAVTAPILRSRRDTVKQYVDADKPIPEDMLPGRLLMRMTAINKDTLRRITSDDARNVRLEDVKLFVESRPRERDYRGTLEMWQKAERVKRRGRWCL